MTTPITDPEHIAVSKSRGIDIDWKDGHRSSYTVEYLRDWCPCATCTGSHGTEPRKKTAKTTETASPFAMYKPRIKMDSIAQSGNYALHIAWNDGHSSGIYSWDHLRRICPCDACIAERSPK
jgi:DUF971 family protein